MQGIGNIITNINNNMEKYYFDEQQPKVQLSNHKALVLLNEEAQTVQHGEMEGIEPTETTQYAYDALWLPNCEREADVLPSAKAYMTGLITSYDTSDKVNGFRLNGKTVWLDKATRVGLMNSTSIAKAEGNESVTLWLDGTSYDVSCDKAISLLSDVEMYALKCYNVTAAHKAAVAELTELEDVLNYDYKAGYPEQLNVEV